MELGLDFVETRQVGELDGEAVVLGHEGVHAEVAVVRLGQQVQGGVHEGLPVPLEARFEVFEAEEKVGHLVLVGLGRQVPGVYHFLGDQGLSTEQLALAEVADGLGKDGGELGGGRGRLLPTHKRNLVHAVQTTTFLAFFVMETFQNDVEPRSFAFSDSVYDLFAGVDGQGEVDVRNQMHDAVRGVW